MNRDDRGEEDKRAVDDENHRDLPQHARLDRQIRLTGCLFAWVWTSESTIAPPISCPRGASGKTGAALMNVSSGLRS